MIKKDKKAAPFIVVGPAKSGTTWLQKLLDTHPDIRCHFQLSLLPITVKHGLYAESKVVLNLNKSPFKGIFKNEEVEKNYFNQQEYLLALQEEIEEHTNRLKVGKSANEQAYLDQLRYNTLKGIFDTFLYDGSDKKFFGNKAYTDLELLFNIYPDAKIVTIIRDGRDVCVSKRFHTFRMGAYYHGDEKNQLLYQLNQSKFGRRVTKKLNRQFGWFGESNYKQRSEGEDLFSEAALTKMATDWALIIKYLLDWQAKKPNQMLIVHYEKLKVNPQQETSRILSFLGADNSEAIIEAIVEKNSFSKLKTTGKNSFFRKGTSGDWKNHFTEKDTQLFKKITGDLLVRLGYEE